MTSARQIAGLSGTVCGSDPAVLRPPATCQPKKKSKHPVAAMARVTRASGAATLLLSAATQANPGILRFQLSDGTLHDFVAAVSQVGGKYMLFGISTNSSSTEPYDVMFIER